MIVPISKALSHLAFLVSAASFCLPASAQIQVAHSPYNDLVETVNNTAGKVFATPEGRAAGAAPLLQALDRLVPMVQANMNKSSPPLKQLFADQLQEYDLFRLALAQPATLHAWQAAMAKGGHAAALAAIDRAAADWLNAGQDTQAQLAAFDSLRAALQAPTQNVSWNFWYNLWTFNPAASEAVGTPLLAYLKQYPNNNTPPARRMLVYVGIKVKHMQLADKPLTIDGPLVSGAHFSTAAWKGKVVLIAGWYSRVAPTVTILPQIQSLLIKHRHEGLEVLGLGYDQTVDAAKTFLAGHQGLTFPQIFLPARMDNDYGCVITGQYRFGSDTFGAAMLLDRQGILHYLDNPLKIDAVETQVLKYLAEAP